MTESSESNPCEREDLPWYLIDLLVDREPKPSKAEQEAMRIRRQLEGPMTKVAWIVPDGSMAVHEGDLFVETAGSPTARRSPEPKWANPFSTKEFGAKAAVEKYRHHILTRPDLLRDIHELKGKELGCWRPSGSFFHAEVLAELVNKFCNGFTGRVLDALVYASTIHKGQMRKGTDIPYITHVVGVANIVRDHWGGEDDVTAALLHDAIEDAGGAARRTDIRKRFGAAVTAIVDGCTDTDQDPKPPWRERKEAYVEHLRKCKWHSVLLVSASDKLHNAKSILDDIFRHGESVWDRFNGKKDGTLWYYKALVDVFRNKVRFGGWRTPWAVNLVMSLEEVVSKMETAKRALTAREELAQLLSAIGEYPDGKNKPDTPGQMTEDAPFPPYP